MKKYYVNNYRQVVFISWTVIIVLLWIQYVYLSSFLTATLLLLVHIPSVYLSVILTNRWFSRAMHGKKLKRFMLHFAAVTLFTAGCQLSMDEMGRNPWILPPFPTSDESYFFYGRFSFRHPFGVGHQLRLLRIEASLRSYPLAEDSSRNTIACFTVAD